MSSLFLNSGYETQKRMHLLWKKHVLLAAIREASYSAPFLLWVVQHAPRSEISGKNKSKTGSMRPCAAQRAWYPTAALSPETIVAGTAWELESWKKIRASQEVVKRFIQRRKQQPLKRGRARKSEFFVKNSILCRKLLTTNISKKQTIKMWYWTSLSLRGQIWPGQVGLTLWIWLALA
jgi:hypothetical protein